MRVISSCSHGQSEEDRRPYVLGSPSREELNRYTKEV